MSIDSADLPTPEFRAHLEWEVTRALRREARLGTGRTIRRRRQVRIVGVATLCIAFGTVCTFASAQVRDGSRRDSLLSDVRADLAVIALRQEIARARLDEASRRSNVGAASAREVSTAQAELDALNDRVARAQLDLAEIQASAQPPRNDFSAPLVGTRDFVTERIKVQLRDAQQQVTAAEAAEHEAERLARTGMATDLELGQAQLKAAQAQAELVVLAKRLDLRREFLDKGTPAELLAKRLAAAQAAEDVRLANQSLELARKNADLVRRMHAAGTAPEVDQLRAELDVRERELELNRLMMQLRRLDDVRRPE